ncbi:MAG TPA: twin-arginine translocase TatA/TatE family subunit [Solirubrobacteraceae bacterium]|nr:twin-arginine translocase TatA/TatE family subunit [Solirubrobacteraceae bacterium]
MGLDNPLHIAFLVVILLLVFGARRLPEIGRSLGSGMREFKDSITGDSKAPAQTSISPPQQQSATTQTPPAQAETAPAPAPSEPTPSA